VEDKDIRHMGLWILDGGSGSEGPNLCSQSIIPSVDFFREQFLKKSPVLHSHIERQGKGNWGREQLQPPH
jgi:hypothetical protein